MVQHAPVLLPLCFFFGALLIPLIAKRGPNWPHGLSVATTALATALAGVSLYRVVAQGPIHYRLGGWVPPVGIELVLDPLSAFVVLVISIVALLVLIHARPGVSKELPGKSLPFYSTAMLLMGGLTGMVVTGDLFNLYVFLEISSLATYALVALGDKRAPVSAFRYLILGSVGASFYLLGLGFLLLRTGSLNMADVSLILLELPTDHAVLIGVILMVIGMGLKMALFPLHGWLPDAYTYASSTATALIAPIGTKVAAYVLIRLLFEVFAPKLRLTAFPLAEVIGFLGVTGILWGSILAIAQTDLKRMLAYSSVGQVGYIAAGIGLGSALGLTAAVLHILNHAWMKGCLFLVNANLQRQLGHTDLTRLDASARRGMPWTSAALVLAALSMIGLPPTAGFFSKWYLVLGAIDQNNWLLTAAVLISSLLNAIYFFRVIEAMYLRPAPAGQPATAATEPPATMLIPTLILSGGLLVLGLGNALIVTHVIRHMIPSGI